MLVLTVLSFLSMDINRHKFLLKVTPDNRKISFQSLFITASNRKLFHQWLLRLSFKKRRRFLQSISFPDSKYPDSFPDSYLS